MAAMARSTQKRFFTRKKVVPAVGRSLQQFIGKNGKVTGVEVEQVGGHLLLMEDAPRWYQPERKRLSKPI